MNPKARKTPERRRVERGFELIVNAAALVLARKRDPAADFPTGPDVREAGSSLVSKLKKVRGRPADPLLSYHVCAFMALHRQTFGKELRAGRTRNSVYDPQLSSRLGDLLVEALREADPGITITTVVDIVIKERRARSTVGKRFEDYFPFYGGFIDPSTGQPMPGPGFRLERFDRLAPIYSS